MFFNLKKIKFNEFISWFLCFFFLFTGLIGFYYFSNKMLIIRYSFVLIFLILSFFLFFKTSFGIVCYTYYNEAKIEFKKIIWPTKKETLYSVGIVFLIIFVTCCFLSIIDSILTKIVFKIIGYSNGI